MKKILLALFLVYSAIIGTPMISDNDRATPSDDRSLMTTTANFKSITLTPTFVVPVAGTTIPTDFFFVTN